MFNNMFTGRSNNNGNGVNTNTNFYTSYSDTAQVVLGGWNKNLSLKIHPCVGKDGNGINQYASDNSQIITTSIVADNAIVLTKAWDEIMVPAVKEGKPKKISIAMGANESRKMLTIEYDGNDFFLEIATALDESGKAGATIKHKFNKKDLMLDYDSTKGSGEQMSIDTDVINFMEKIRGVQRLTPMEAHANNYLNATKAAYAARANNNTNSGVNDYIAPTSSTSGEDFLPFN